MLKIFKKRGKLPVGVFNVKRTSKKNRETHKFQKSWWIKNSFELHKIANEHSINQIPTMTLIKN